MAIEHASSSLVFIVSVPNGFWNELWKMCFFREVNWIPFASDSPLQMVFNDLFPCYAGVPVQWACKRIDDPAVRVWYNFQQVLALCDKMLLWSYIQTYWSHDQRIKSRFGSRQCAVVFRNGVNKRIVSLKEWHLIYLNTFINLLKS